MIWSEIRGMTFTRCLLDTRASIKAVFNCHHLGELQPLFIELCLADGSVRKFHGIVEDVIVRIEDCYFLLDFLIVDMKMTKELSQAPIILAILSYCESRHRLGEMRINSKGGREYSEGRHQLVNEIPFLSF